MRHGWVPLCFFVRARLATGGSQPVANAPGSDSSLINIVFPDLEFVTLDHGFLAVGAVDPFGGRNEADVARIEDVAVAHALEIELQGLVASHRRVAGHW